MSMRRNLSSETSEKHWDFVKRVADLVSQWPAWKQAQFRIVIGDHPTGAQFGDERLRKQGWGSTKGEVNL